ncbi:hypothetical protein [Roseateles saccharophilus]|uniref:Uncharacterized protein n=1 Tax=Roseateles saccharophilus TaxID=304 RepID=A0A4R3U939_ROSSA|nr:hypothetical protein [Roseateles saccharophilus]MDG0835801.1 hypothetical protein [Roseateles saccharophilus]TCU83753.1 hypothetical protein EV671_105617 [Roseateles saccharophilus]
MALSVKKPRDYDTRVFINCPFDDEYKPLFDAIVFTIHDLGFQARHALIDNSSVIRVERIATEIATCKYSIHDMSRVEVGANKLPRFNMPFEAGIAYTVHALQPKGREHHMGVLDSKPYQYQASISDLAGLDPKVHGNDPDQVIQCVREILQRTCASASRPLRHGWRKLS